MIPLKIVQINISTVLNTSVISNLNVMLKQKLDPGFSLINMENKEEIILDIIINDNCKNQNKEICKKNSEMREKIILNSLKLLN